MRIHKMAPSIDGVNNNIRHFEENERISECVCQI